MNPAAAAEALGSIEFAAVLEVIARRATGPVAAARLNALRPSNDPQFVASELRLVGEMLSLLRRGERLEIPGVADIRSAVARLRVDGSVLELSELIDIRRTLAAGRTVSAELARVAEMAPALAELRAGPVDREIERRLERTVSDEGELLDTASPELAAARREVHAARERLIRRLEAILRGLDSGGAVTLRGGRYVIPVRRDARNRPDGIIHDESGSSGTLFIEPSATIELGNALRAAIIAEERAILAVLRELTDLLRPAQEAIAALHEMCVVLDTLHARANWANDCDAEVPEQTGIGGRLALQGARHPLLLARGIDVVPFDLVMDETERTLLISGPNTGGKTVLLKTVALAVLLVQSGVVPPLGRDSAVPHLTSLFVDIGDHQSIAADLSTFSAHVAELRKILDTADAGALVILDEVGSGTDPAEGGALAMAVLEELTRRRTLTIATTHLGALKSLAGRVPGVVNGSLQFEAATLSPTYRFTKGIPGRSYGLAIARRLGVDQSVLELAEAHVPEMERQLDQLLASIEAREQQLLRREAELSEQLTELERREVVVDVREREVSTRDAELRQREKTAERDMARQAKAYLLEARKQVEAALALAKGAADAAAAREARRLIEEGVRQEAARLDEEAPPTSGSAPVLAVGNSVRLSTGAVGEVAELRGDGRAVVQVGTMRLVVRTTTLTPVAPREKPRQQRVPRGDVPERHADWEIDLRGMRTDEAEREVLAAIDGAVLAEQPWVRIIHGMGTGVLRDVVRRLLESDRRVASFDFAPRNQGGTGVTIAVLG
jgi:DNA mismatch repair protein MutS2